MIRRPPRSTRTDTLFPDTPLFRSSFSHGLAVIWSSPERTSTLTSLPPSRRAERQQSIAVLPPPSTSTRLPTFVTWPKETLASQTRPTWMFDAPSRRTGRSRWRPRGGPVSQPREPNREREAEVRGGLLGVGLGG